MPDETRQQHIQALYTRNFHFILDTASADSLLLIDDINNVASGVALHLDSYTGPIDDDAFQSWVSDIVQSAVTRVTTFHQIKKTCENQVYSAIWEILVTAKDLGICDQSSADEIAQLVWVWTLENLDSLCDENQPAKPSTRLHDKAYWFARAEKTRQLRARERFAKVDNLDRIGRDDSGNTFVEPDSETESAVS